MLYEVVCSFFLLNLQISTKRSPNRPNKMPEDPLLLEDLSSCTFLECFTCDWQISHAVLFYYMFKGQGTGKQMPGQIKCLTKTRFHRCFLAMFIVKKQPRRLQKRFHSFFLRATLVGTRSGDVGPGPRETAVWLQK